MLLLLLCTGLMDYLPTKHNHAPDENGYFNDFGLSETQIKQLVHLSRILDFPPLPKFGTVVSVIYKYYFDSYVPWYEYIPDWDRYWDIFNMQFEELLYLVLETLTNSNNLVIFPLELSSILRPTPSFKRKPLLSYAFPKTFNIHKTLTGMSADEIFQQENYFGRILGQHLDLVMEMMYHNTLR
jgi:hypothetical protein